MDEKSSSLEKSRSSSIGNVSLAVRPYIFISANIQLERERERERSVILSSLKVPAGCEEERGGGGFHI